jgi:hypothetical protein
MSKPPRPSSPGCFRPRTASRRTSCASWPTSRFGRWRSPMSLKTNSSSSPPSRRGPTSARCWISAAATSCSHRRSARRLRKAGETPTRASARRTRSARRWNGALGMSFESTLHEAPRNISYNYWEENDKGTLYRVCDMVVTLHHALDYHNYPFDRTILEFRLTGDGRFDFTEREFAPDAPSLELEGAAMPPWIRSGRLVGGDAPGRDLLGRETRPRLPDEVRSRREAPRRHLDLAPIHPHRRGSGLRPGERVPRADHGAIRRIRDDRGPAWRSDRQRRPAAVVGAARPRARRAPTSSTDSSRRSTST